MGIFTPTTVAVTIVPAGAVTISDSGNARDGNFTTSSAWTETLSFGDVQPTVVDYVFSGFGLPNTSDSAVLRATARVVISGTSGDKRGTAVMSTSAGNLRCAFDPGGPAALFSWTGTGTISPSFFAASRYTLCSRDDVTTTPLLASQFSAPTASVTIRFTIQHPLTDGTHIAAIDLFECWIESSAPGVENAGEIVMEMF